MLLYYESCGRQQLPVAVVAEYAGTRLSSVETLLNLVGAPEFDVPEQLLAAHRHKLDGLDKVVAEPSVEPVFYGDALLHALFGKCRRYVAPYYVAAVAHNVVENEVGYV